MMTGDFVLARGVFIMTRVDIFSLWQERGGESWGGGVVSDGGVFQRNGRAVDAQTMTHAHFCLVRQGLGKRSLWEFWWWWWW